MFNGIFSSDRTDVFVNNQSGNDNKFDGYRKTTNVHNDE